MTDITSSILQIRDEAHGMVATAKAIKGKKHGEALHVLLLVAQMVDILCVMNAMIPPGHERTTGALRANADQTLAKIAGAYTEAAGINEAELIDIVNDADAISATMRRLVTTAVSAAGNGTGFGG